MEAEEVLQDLMELVQKMVGFPLVEVVLVGALEVPEVTVEVEAPMLEVEADSQAVVVVYGVVKALSLVDWG